MKKYHKALRSFAVFLCCPIHNISFLIFSDTLSTIYAFSFGSQVKCMKKLTFFQYPSTDRKLQVSNPSVCCTNTSVLNANKRNLFVCDEILVCRERNSYIINIDRFASTHIRYNLHNNIEYKI